MARLKAGAAAAQLSRTAFQAALGRHFLLRLHMFVIVGGTFAIALATTRVLLWAHVNKLPWRYGIAVTAAFAAFIGFVRVWLDYIHVCAKRAQQRDADWLSGFNFSSGGGGSVSSASDALRAGGGSFGGGGSSGSWGDPVATPQPVVVAPIPQSAKSGFSLTDCVDDDLGLVILAVLLVVAIAAAAIYLVYAAPAILGEAAFQAALTASLANHAKKVAHGSWIGSIIKATLLPFLGILAMAVFVGWYAQQHCPSATRLRDAFVCAPR